MVMTPEQLIELAPKLKAAKEELERLGVSKDQVQDFLAKNNVTKEFVSFEYTLQILENLIDHVKFSGQ